MSGPSRPTEISGLSSVGGTGRGEIQPTPSTLNCPSGASPANPAALGTSVRDVGTDRLAQLFWKAKHETITYCAVFWAFGMCVAFLGPTLRDLGCKTGSTTPTMSWIFFAQALFILIGSATAGLLITRFSVNYVLLLSTAMLAVTLALIPLCNAIGLLALIMAIMGYFMGTIDSICNLSMINLYGKLVAPFLQMLHFFYGLGAFVSPMVAEPFLLNENCNFLIDNLSTDDPSFLINATVPAKTLIDAQKMTRVDDAFWIMALLQIPVIILVVTLAMKSLFFTTETQAVQGTSLNKLKEDYENVEMGVTKTTSSLLVTPITDEHPPASTTQIYLVTMLTALLLFLYDGLQASYGGYIYSYAVQNFSEMSSSEAAYLNAYFWGTFALGRLFSIIIATKISPGVMLLGNIGGCIFSMLFMLIWNKSRAVLYIGTCLFGAFLSSIYPTAISLAEQFVRVTSGITSFIVVGAAAGEMLFPVIVGHQFDWAPINFLVTGFAVTLFSLFVYASIWMIGSTILRKQGEPGFMGAVLSLMPIKVANGANEETGLVSRNVKYYSRMRNASESNDGDAADPEEINYGEAIEINHDDYRRQ